MRIETLIAPLVLMATGGALVFIGPSLEPGPAFAIYYASRLALIGGAFLLGVWAVGAITRGVEWDRIR